GAPEDEGEDRNEEEAPGIAQVIAMKPDEAAAEPEEICGEEIDAMSGAAALLAPDEGDRHDREDDERRPGEPMRKNEGEGRHGPGTSLGRPGGGGLKRKGAEGAPSTENGPPPPQRRPRPGSDVELVVLDPVPGHIADRRAHHDLELGLEEPRRVLVLV